MKYSALLSLIILFGGFTSQAQEPLSLAEAISIGLQRNYNIRIEQRNVAVAENSNAWGETGILPSVSIGLQSQNALTNQKSDNLFFGGQLFPGFELTDQRSYGLTPIAQVSWTIQGHKAFMTKRRLEQLEAESNQNAEVVVANTLQSIILGYYIAVLEKDRLNEFRKQMKLSKDRFEYVQTRYDIGGAVSSDLLLEENNYLTDSSNYLNQQLIYHNAIRNLNVMLVNEDLNKEYILTDSLVFEDNQYTYDNLEKEMLSENVDLKKIYLSQSILETRVRETRADQMPSLSANLGYQWTRNSSDLTSAEYTGENENYQNPPQPLISKTGRYFANFTLSFNLYNGGRVNRAIRNSLLQEDIGNMRVDQLTISLKQDLMEAYERYQIRRQLYGISSRREEAAQKNLTISEEKFKNGSINSFDYRVVQNNYLSASIQRYQALYNLMDSKVELLRLTGGLIARYNQ